MPLARPTASTSSIASPAPRVLLIEDLDALGADPTDTRERAEWLSAAGARVTWLSVAGDHFLGSSPDAGTLAAHVVPRRAAASALREAASSAKWDRVFLASARRGGGPLARWLPEGTEWWPTGLTLAAGSLDPRTWFSLRTLGRTLPALDGWSETDPESLLAWSAIDSPASRHVGLPLWDGELVLAPEGFSGRAGEEALRAFAGLADEWSGVDLVSWDHPTSRARERPRALGIEMRVHQVGPPTRPAEHSWWRHASAAVFAGCGSMSTGVVLRALDAGCPLLWVGASGSASRLAGCLSEAGCARQVAPDAAQIASALEEILGRGAEIEGTITRGRSFAARHDGAGLAHRLAVLLGTARPDASAAA